MLFLTQTAVSRNSTYLTRTKEFPVKTMRDMGEHHYRYRDLHDLKALRQIPTGEKPASKSICAIETKQCPTFRSVRLYTSAMS